jgi:signal recognition particle receptor subunit beta
MPYNDSSDTFPSAHKLLIAGGFGVGKTTFVGAVSEIQPLRTEEILTVAGALTDDLSGVGDKNTTTVAMDFGRITIDRDHVLYLFGTPGQERFWFMWDELSIGALGAVVLVDTRRLQDSFAAVDFFESRGVKIVLAVNEFDGAYHYEPGDLRAALDLGHGVPVVYCDARDRTSAILVLIHLIRHLLGADFTSPASGVLA